MDGPTFLAYVEQVLVPTLKRSQIVVMDNLPVPKAAGVEEAIKATRGRQPQGIVRVRLQRSPATESPAARAGNYSRNGLSSCPLVSPAHPHA
jgi:hypothetical protein